MKGFWRRSPPVSVGHHVISVIRRFPSFSFKYEGGKPTWRGRLQPSSCSPAYSVKIVYSLGDVPRVWVVSPPLDSKAPHRFPDGSLCLFYPKDHSWHSGLLIADTIIPWAAEWLMFYELWQETGVFLGPEAPHPQAEPKRPD